MFQESLFFFGAAEAVITSSLHIHTETQQSSSLWGQMPLILQLRLCYQSNRRYGPCSPQCLDFCNLLISQVIKTAGQTPSKGQTQVVLL